MNERKCSIDGCDRRHKGRGLCSAHLQRLRNTGSATPPEDKVITGYDSIGRPIWRRVEDPKTKLLSRAVPAQGGCIVWTGSKNNNVYGHITINGQIHYTHRLSYELHIGPIPEGLVLDHLCRTRACLNPHHLEPVTQGENTRRGEPAQRTHCPAGHPYDEANTRLRNRTDTKRGTAVTSRECKTCDRDRGRRQYATRTHCDQGHEYTDDNVILARDGKRWCKTCRESSYERRRKP